MKNNKWLLYFLYGLLLICYAVFSQRILDYLYVQRSRTLEVFPYMIWSTIIYSAGGALLGLDKFLSEVKKEGNWKLNWPKALFLGIPALCLSLGLFIGSIPIPFIRDTLFHPFFFLYISKINLIPIFQMAFGYILIISFFKIDMQSK